MSDPKTALALAGMTIGGNDFVVAEWTAPGSERMLIAPPHVHHADDEAWYVLSGVLHVQVGPDEVRAPAGSCVFVPRGTPHTYWNPGPDDARYLLIMTPKIHALIQAIHAASDRSRAALTELFKRYDSDLVELATTQG